MRSSTGSGLGIERRFAQAEQGLEGWPSGALTLLLLTVAAILVLIALRGTAMEKAIALSWAVFP